MQSWDNRILSNVARIEYIPIINRMFNTSPDMMSRKIPEANVQQAYVYDRVGGLISDDKEVLSVGCFEDTAYDCLVKRGWNIVGIDPDVNGDTLDSFYNRCNHQFDIIFSTSVLEHVKDDELFIKQICNLLKLGGYAILTVDFLDSYKQGDPLHATAVRFYTDNDLNTRLRSIIEKQGCSFVSEPDWFGEPDFWYQGHTYSLATMIFRKDSNV